MLTAKVVLKCMKWYSAKIAFSIGDFSTKQKTSLVAQTSSDMLALDTVLLTQV